MKRQRRRPKRGRGRPKLPWEYWEDLVSLGVLEGHWLPGKPPKRLEDLRNPRGPQGLSAACQMIIKGGPLRWVRDRVTVAEISDWKTLRTRILEARRRPELVMPRWKLPGRSTVLWWGKKGEGLPIRGRVIKRYQQPPVVERLLHEKYE